MGTKITWFGCQGTEPLKGHGGGKNKSMLWVLSHLFCVRSQNLLSYPFYH